MRREKLMYFYLLTPQEAGLDKTHKPTHNLQQASHNLTFIFTFILQSHAVCPSMLDNRISGPVLPSEIDLLGSAE